MTASWKISGWLGVLALLVMVSMPAQASVITYSTLGDFNAASMGNTVLDFNTFPAGENWLASPYVPAAGVSITANTSMYTIGIPLGGWGWLTGGAVEVQNIGYITLPANITAVALNTLDCGFQAQSVVLTVGGVDQAPVALPGVDQAYVFFGATSDQPISKIAVHSTVGWGFIDNVTYGTAIPEPVSGALVLLGALAGLGLRRFRRV
jgi:hypothetical protein